MNTNAALTVYQSVISEYVTNMKTQENIATELGISIEAVRWCTQYCGYDHTKLKEGKKPLVDLADLEELCKLL